MVVEMSLLPRRMMDVEAVFEMTPPGGASAALIEVPPACGVLAGGIHGDRGSLGNDLKLICDSALAMLTVSEDAKLRRSASLALSFCIFYKGGFVVIEPCKL